MCLFVCIIKRARVNACACTYVCVCAYVGAHACSVLFQYFLTLLLFPASFLSFLPSLINSCFLSYFISIFSFNHNASRLSTTVFFLSFFSSVFFLFFLTMFQSFFFYQSIYDLYGSYVSTIYLSE